MCCLPESLTSRIWLPLTRDGETPGDCFFCSAVRTLERAATAAALCDDLWVEEEGLGTAVLVPPVDGLNAEDKAAKADAL